MMSGDCSTERGSVGRGASAIIFSILVAAWMINAAESENGMTGFTAAEMQSTVTRTVRWRYLLHLPDGYDRDARRWPLLLYLHGGMGRGSDFKQMAWYPIIAMIMEKDNVPFIVVAPQCPENESWLDADALIALLDSVSAACRVDSERVYLSGYSMGGEGVWHLAYKHPDRFAAIAPMSGYCNPFWADRLKNLPVWAFHGGKDDRIPVSITESMIKAIRENGGEAKLSIDPERAHAPPSREEHAALLRWFLEHRRGTVPGQGPKQAQTEPGQDDP